MVEDPPNLEGQEAAERVLIGRQAEDVLELVLVEQSIQGNVLCKVLDCFHRPLLSVVVDLGRIATGDATGNREEQVPKPRADAVSLALVEQVLVAHSAPNRFSSDRSQSSSGSRQEYVSSHSAEAGTLTGAL
ncbi:MAG: hypothetical protein F4X37_03985 [Acidimicrobiia bacterium]|nr:hypothetical protein [bacterium]MXZ31794.1 hypothetical protein [Acidimicrobiia bacterium]MYB24258.1 hypothetical protein [Acidimicrobiia bacterium]